MGARPEEPAVELQHDERQQWLSADLACRLAAIDIGSNSVRLFVAEALRGAAYRILDEEREPTRLGRSVSAADARRTRRIHRKGAVQDRRSAQASGRRVD